MKEPEFTFAVFYKIRHWKLPENEKANGAPVVLQSVKSLTDEDNDENRMQAKRQACGYAAKCGKTIFPDEVGFEIEFIRTEERINGRRKSVLVRTKRTRKVTPSPVASPPVVQRKPQQAAFIY